MWGRKVFSVLCKFSYNAWEGTNLLKSTSADTVWFVKIVEESVAAHDIEDDYGDKISQGHCRELSGQNKFNQKATVIQRKVNQDLLL